MSQKNERFYPPNIVRAAITGFFNEENEEIEKGVAERIIFENDCLSFSVVQIARKKKLTIRQKEEEVIYLPLYGEIIPHLFPKKIVINNVSSYQNAYIILIRKKSEWNGKDDELYLEYVKEKEIFQEKYIYHGLKSRIDLEMKASIIDMPPHSVFDAVRIPEDNVEEYFWYIPIQPNNETLPIVTARIIYKLIERASIKSGNEHEIYLLFKVKANKIGKNYML